MNDDFNAISRREELAKTRKVCVFEELVHVGLMFLIDR
jgi:hypothetical protein